MIRGHLYNHNHPPYCAVCSHAVLIGTGMLRDNVVLEERKLNRWKWFLRTKCYV